MTTVNTTDTANTPHDPPAAVTYLATADDGIYDVTVTCPYCYRAHRRHGAGRAVDGPPRLGHRLAHCGRADGGGYYLTVTAATDNRTGDQR